MVLLFACRHVRRSGLRERGRTVVESPVRARGGRRDAQPRREQHSKARRMDGWMWRCCEGATRGFQSFGVKWIVWSSSLPYLLSISCWLRCPLSRCERFASERCRPHATSVGGAGHSLRVRTRAELLVRASVCCDSCESLRWRESQLPVAAHTSGSLLPSLQVPLDSARRLRRSQAQRGRQRRQRRQRRCNLLLLRRLRCSHCRQL